MSGGRPMTHFDANQHDTHDTGEPTGNQQFDGERRLDAVFGTLSNERRRHVVGVLRDLDAETVGVERVAEGVATREASEEGAGRVELSLRHTHLPKLSEAGVLSYAPERSQVRYEDPPLVERLLDQL